MTETLFIDYAWKHPSPAAIKAAGYHGVIRYLSTDPTKDITKAEAAALHKAGLAILLVWETTATRALAGTAAGIADRLAAEKAARALGYPKACPIFYACDTDAAPNKVRAYYDGVHRAAVYPMGIYGSARVIEGITTTHVYRWQTEAWSGGAVSKGAHLYQRVKPTRKIKGAVGGWDEDVVLHTLPTWGPPAPVKPAAKPAPKTPAAVAPPVTPQPAPTLSPQDVSFLRQILAFLRQLFGKKTP